MNLLPLALPGNENFRISALKTTLCFSDGHAEDFSGEKTVKREECLNSTCFFPVHKVTSRGNLSLSEKS